MKEIDLTGMQFGKLTVTDRIRYKGRWCWNSICSCNGKQKKKPTGPFDLLAGKVTSCGCMLSEITAERNRKNATHNKTKTITYTSWVEMRRRCRSKGRDNSKNYSDRNIKVCERWGSFENFIEDMKERPSKEYSIDRIDPFGNYEKSNCKWSTATEQAKNKTTTVRLTYSGETKTVHEWSISCGIPASTLLNRKRCGWTDEEAITIPKRKQIRNKYNAH